MEYKLPELSYERDVLSYIKDHYENNENNTIIYKNVVDEENNQKYKTFCDYSDVSNIEILYDKNFYLLLSLVSSYRNCGQMEILFGLRDIRYMRYPKWVK